MLSFLPIRLLLLDRMLDTQERRWMKILAITLECYCNLFFYFIYYLLISPDIDRKQSGYTPAIDRFSKFSTKEMSKAVRTSGIGRAKDIANTQRMELWSSCYSSEKKCTHRVQCEYDDTLLEQLKLRFWQACFLWGFVQFMTLPADILLILIWMRVLDDLSNSRMMRYRTRTSAAHA